jgi:general secretion pathway protein A
LQTNPYFRFFGHFGLRENPFAVSPDPKYLYLTPQIQEAWDALSYGIQSREGIILLTGEAGTGKTTLVNRLLEWLRERRMPTAFIFNSHLEPRHLFDFMLADFGVAPDPRWQGNALLGLSQWLRQAGRDGQTPVLIVDEGQGLPIHVLEEIRLLMNLETPDDKLLQIVLVGQPELEEKLNRADMRQLKQRIALRCRTAPLTLKETHEYIQARVKVAGAPDKAIFSPDAVAAIHAYSRGIPRVMNLLSEHALINAYAGNLHVVPARVVDEVAREFQFERETGFPSVPHRIMETPARALEPMVFTDTSVMPVQSAGPAAARAREESGATAASLAPIDRVPALTASEQLVMAIPSVSEPMRTLANSGVSPVSARPSTASAVSNAGRTSMRKPIVSHTRHTLDRMTARMNSKAKALANRSPNLLSPMIRAQASEKAGEVREALYQTWARVFNARAWRKFDIAVKSHVRLGAERASAAYSETALALILEWRDAKPAWRRMKSSATGLLRRPLANQQLSTATKPISARPQFWSKLTLPPQFSRSWRKSLARFQPVALASSRLNVNAPVRRWLRQPIRPSQLLHSASRVTSQRNRMHSAR